MHRLRLLLLLPMLLFLPLLLAPALAQPASEAAAQAAYKALLKEYTTAQETFQQALQEAKTKEDREKVVRDKFPEPRAYAPRFMAIATKYPKSAPAVDALIWVAMNPVDPRAKEYELRAAAFKALGTTHVKDNRLGAFCTGLVNNIDHASEEFLLNVMTKATKVGVKARALASLAHTLKHRSRVVRQLKEDVDSRKAYELSWGKPTIDALIQVDPAAFEKASVKYFENLLETYPKVQHPTHQTLGQFAQAHLTALRDPVEEGKPAPDIVGEDLAGKPLKLSDHQGKVVLLDFWGISYHPSRVQLAYERELVKRLAGKPFVLLGVNSDTDRAGVRKSLLAEGIGWRSWWDGGAVGGPIATRWEVELWPSLFLIDPKGVVRNVWTGWPDRKLLEETIGKLLDATQKGD